MRAFQLIYAQMPFDYYPDMDSDLQSIGRLIYKKKAIP